MGRSPRPGCQISKRIERDRVSKKKAKPNPAAKSGPDFEQCLEELSSIVGRLESGELTLDESLEQYELGVNRLMACYNHLTAAERRIEVVSGVDAEGNPVAKPFDELADDQVQHDSTTRSRKRSTPRERQRAADFKVADDSSSLF